MELAGLPRGAALAWPGGGSRWHSQAAPVPFAEIFADAGDAGGAGAAIALAAQALRMEREGAVEERPILWVQEARAMRLAGRPFRPGLPPAWQRRIIHVAAKTAQDALFALEEGLRCRDLACVIGEVAGNPKAFDFTASRRLALAAEKHGNMLFLLRHDAAADLSAARLRWQMRSAPSLPSRWDAGAPGFPQWHGHLFRARAHPPGEWILRDDANMLAAAAAGAAPAPDHGDLVRAAGAGSA